jgi:hypothetical protein
MPERPRQAAANGRVNWKQALWLFSWTETVHLLISSDKQKRKQLHAGGQPGGLQLLQLRGSSAHGRHPH